MEVCHALESTQNRVVADLAAPMILNFDLELEILEEQQREVAVASVLVKRQAGRAKLCGGKIPCDGATQRLLDVG